MLMMVANLHLYSPFDAQIFQQLFKTPAAAVCNNKNSNAARPKQAFFTCLWTTLYLKRQQKNLITAGVPSLYYRNVAESHLLETTRFGVRKFVAGASGFI